MIFTETKLKGAYVVDLEHHEDDRGFFARSWDAQEFDRRSLDGRLAQCNVSFNKKRGTLRGMHYQAEPFPEAKLVRCTMGAIYDVILDLRPDSPTFKLWVAEELTAANRRALYVPAGFAHGFQTLADDTEVFYQMTEFFHSECTRGVRWDDSAFNIRWPLPEGSVMSQQDLSFPDFRPD
jgi:dTDP-4-dehydrorhamnose 3,5-epimerase